VHVDIRLPIGGLFSVIGVILFVVGVLTFGNDQMYAPSLGINVNFWWGLALLAFGLIMLYFGRRGVRRGQL